METSAHRIASIDVLRGLIVVLMALDHTRIYFSAAQFDPLDLVQTDAGWYVMRIITHLCAPGFFFLAGVGAAMAESQNGNKSQLAFFLATRGVWLVALEFTVMGAAWSFGFGGWFWFGVLWGLGASMVMLAALIFVPRAVLLVAAGIAMALQSQWLAHPPSALEGLWMLLGSGGVWAAPFVGPKLVLYPVLPWLCLMVLGYSGSAIVVRAGRLREKELAALGGALLLGFLVLRAIGFGGVPLASSEHPIMSFFNVEKYPPSLQFSLLTLGVLLVFLGAFARLERNGSTPRWLEPLRIFGRAPFFFYVTHIYIIHGAALLVAIILNWPWREYLFWSGPWPNLVPPESYGVNALGVCLVWVLVIAFLFALCSWFAGVKTRTPVWWLRYF